MNHVLLSFDSYGNLAKELQWIKLPNDNFQVVHYVKRGTAVKEYEDEVKGLAHFMLYVWIVRVEVDRMLACASQNLSSI